MRPTGSQTLNRVAPVNCISTRLQYIMQEMVSSMLPVGTLLAWPHAQQLLKQEWTNVLTHWPQWVLKFNWGRGLERMKGVTW